MWLSTPVHDNDVFGGCFSHCGRFLALQWSLQSWPLDIVNYYCWRRCVFRGLFRPSDPWCHGFSLQRVIHSYFKPGMDEGWTVRSVNFFVVFDCHARPGLQSSDTYTCVSLFALGARQQRKWRYALPNLKAAPTTTPIGLDLWNLSCLELCECMLNWCEW